MTRSHSILVILAALTVGAAPPLSAQQLTPVEERIRDYLYKHQADQVALLAKSVNIKSQTLDLPGVPRRRQAVRRSPRRARLSHTVGANARVDASCRASRR